MQLRSMFQLDKEAIERFCHRWKIQTLDLFGSILRNDFGPDSDIDLLVTFVQGTRWTLFDWVQMEDELTALFGRSVELVSRQAIEQSYNEKRRERILQSAQPFVSLTGQGASYAMA